MRIVLSYLLLMSILVATIDPIESWARRNPLTAEQKEYLASAQHIRIHTLALTEKGVEKSIDIHQAVAERMKTMGLTVIKDPSTPHDVMLKVKCEERRSLVAMNKIGGDADQPGAPSRLWKGPACQLTYSIDKQVTPWRQEVRTEFEDAWEAAKTHGQTDSGLYALEHLRKALLTSDFPFALLAEWKQATRMASFLAAKESSTATKEKIIHVAKNMASPEMLRALELSMTDTNLAPKAIRAMGYMGTAATSRLLQMLEDSDSAEIKALAAQALGEVGSHSGDMTILPPLLAMMESPTIDLQVQIEIVKALGKIPDHQSEDPLRRLGVKTWTSRSDDPRMQELRETIELSLWHINPSPHSE